ncbi:DUF3575 domain-containing protein [Pedobacter changchengzhani]|uniref:DUF3575 domain-containing protein n=1 Tax=Pedobacter changchengzhani TaxID=2529274 RepID=A0A4R5MP01_9SPHI|nr:DUF3575 domain-containing protein [Pedobacter changchengzhani]TDG37532.1 DUF3575 domain-containing protein [Pedobacter changchengzhani]
MNLNLKKLGLTFVIGLGCLQVCLAQTNENSAVADGANLIKLNLPSLALKTLNVQYERAIYGKTSVGLGIRVMPKGSLPFSSLFNDIDDQLGSLELGNVAITPEIKFYLGKGVFKGFYIAPYLRYANYNASINYEFTSNNKTEIIPLSGKLNTYTAGVLFGAQWEIANKLYLDWSIFGPQYGISQGSLIGKKTLDTQEQKDLRDELDGIDLPVGKVTYTVDGNGASVNLKGPWAGIRANIGIGYRF